MNKLCFCLSLAIVVTAGCSDSAGDANNESVIPTEIASAGDTTWRTVAELRSDLRANDKAKFLSLIHISEPTRPY